MNVVSENALKKRINRRLQEGETLRKVRGRYYNSDIGNPGDYYIVDAFNAVVASHCDLEKLGRELGVLKPNETVSNKGD